MKSDPPWFLTTRWTLLGEAAGTGGAESLNELCRQYWGPVHTYHLRAGCHPQDAQDLTQEFFRDFMARDGFAQARRFPVEHVTRRLRRDVART